MRVQSEVRVSGRKQHYIPQSLIREFSAFSTGKIAKVWVYTKDKSAYLASSKDVAARRHFYSKVPPTPKGLKTLDDHITDYENELVLRLSSIRTISAGGPVDPAIAAELVTHLVVRNSHIRDTFGAGVTTLLTGVRAFVSNEENARRLLGLAGQKPAGRFLKYIEEEILTEGSLLSRLDLPEPVLHRVIFALAKENFGRGFLEQMPMFEAILDKLALGVDEVVQGGHTRMLATTLAPEERIMPLAALTWTIVSAPDGGVVLPDCVALGVDAGGNWEPLASADAENLSIVLMPIAYDRVLIGRRNDLKAIDLVDFNRAAAAASHSFFLAANRDAEFERLAASIGTRSWVVIENAVRDALRESIQTYDDTAIGAHSGIEKASTSSFDGERTDSIDQSGICRDRTVEGLHYQIQFIGCADSENANQISAIVSPIVAAMNGIFPLDRLDGITFAADYAAALRDLDRGFLASEPLTTTVGEWGIGFAMAPLAMRNGLVKGRVIIRGEIGQALIGSDALAHSKAVGGLVYMLALVACAGLIDRCLPGILLRQVPDSYNAYLYPHIDGAWNSYFAARISAGVSLDIEVEHPNMLVSMLGRAKKSILTARLAYRFDGDLDKLLRTALSEIGAILQHTAVLLGYYDGLSQSLVDDEVGLRDALQEIGLWTWFEAYQRDLQHLWNRCGMWKSFSEFLDLTRHVERLLWQFGIFPWQTPDGTIRVEVPLVTDGHILARAQSKDL